MRRRASLLPVCLLSLSLPLPLSLSLPLSISSTPSLSLSLPLPLSLSSFSTPCLSVFLPNSPSPSLFLPTSLRLNVREKPANGSARCDELACDVRQFHAKTARESPAESRSRASEEDTFASRNRLGRGCAQTLPFVTPKPTAIIPHIRIGEQRTQPSPVYLCVMWMSPVQCAKNCSLHVLRWHHDDDIDMSICYIVARWIFLWRIRAFESS